MAGKQVGHKFLSPAHFQVFRPKATAKQQSKETNLKLLAPGELGIAKKKDPPPKTDENPLKKEVDSLREETGRLNDLFKHAKDRELDLEEECRKSRVNLQRSRVGDAIDLRRLAELEEENAVLQTEARKHKAVISKLKNEIKQNREAHEMEIDKLEADINNYLVSIRQLKQEVKEKDMKFENEIENLQKQCKKQSSFIKVLRDELKKAQEQVDIDRTGFENIISNSESQKYREVKGLEEALRNCEGKYTQELTVLKRSLIEKDKVIDTVQTGIAEKDAELKEIKEKTEKKEMEYEDQVKEFSDQLKQSQEHFEDRSKEFQNALQECMLSHEVAMTEQRDKLQAKDKQLKDERALIEQLRTYIGENLPNIQLERLHNENKELKENVITLIKENEILKSNGELMNIRMTSLNEILVIQEKELSRSQGESGDDLKGLLNRWRQKVFALMVQRKSQDISHKMEKHESNKMVKKLTQKLQSTKNELEVLSHTLNDRNAELQIETNTSASLAREMEDSKAKMTKLSTCIETYNDIIGQLYDDSCNVRPVMQQQLDKMNDAFEKIALLTQRVNFAAGRIQFLQGLLARKEAHWRAELSDALRGKQNDGDVSDDQMIESSLPYQQLLTEVEKLMNERDMLAANVAKDAEQMEGRADIIRMEYDDRLEMSARRISQLQSELNDERERCAALMEKQETSECDMKEARQTIETIKTDLARHQSTAERALDHALEEERAKFTEEFANIEKQFNDVRREHTKAVVALRQSERQVTREQEKAKEQIALQRKELESQLEKCRDQIRNLEKEKNMLMATVRQEGLKAPRVKPKAYTSSADESDHNSEKENTAENMAPIPVRKGKSSRTRTKLDRNKHPRTGNPTVAGAPNDPQMDAVAMATVLKDLQSLSAALLTMDDDVTNTE